MINITINSDGSTSQDVISLGSQFENLDETIQFTFPTDLEPLNKYVVAKTYDDSKKENITRVTPLVDNKFIVGRAITKVTGQWLLYTLCKAYSPDGDVERVSISDPIIATVNENDFDISDIETAEVDPNIKIIYDELKELKKTLEANEATRQANETSRVEAENGRVSAETARANEEQARQSNEAHRVGNETNRASAETARASAETARANAEAKRATAETARTTAEANRAIAEQSRIDAEKLRVTADKQREDNTNNAIKTMTDSTNKAIDTLNEKIGIIDGLRTDIDANTKADGVTQRSLTALWDLNKGISYKFEDDNTKAYQKTVLTGAKLGAVNAIGGRTIVYNQYSQIENGDSGWALKATNYKNLHKFSNHKLYVMQKYVVKEIVDNSRPNYIKQLIIFGDENVTVDSQQLTLSDITIGKTFLNKSIVQAPNNTREIFLYAFGDNSNGLTIKCNTWVNIIDLTQMFGSGNEPSTVEEFEKMFSLDYYQYNEGTLMSMGTSEVVEQGKNYFDFSKLPTGDTMNVGGGDGASTSKVKVDFSKQTITIPPKTYYANTKKTLKDLCHNITPDTYIITMNRSNIDNNGFIYLYDNDVFFYLGTPRKLSNADLNSKVIFYNSSSSENENVISNIQIEKASTATTYAPYQEKTFTIPQAILDLEGYGWGVGTAYNYVDYTSKTFHKCVGKYTVTGNEYFMSNENLGYIGANSSNAYFVKDLGHKQSETTNSISNKLTRVPYNWSVDSTYNTMEFNGTQLHIRILNSELGITSEATTSEVATAVKNYCKKLYDSGDPIVIYYELATPIVTDISDIIDDTFQEPFNVEGGGSLTFKNTNGDGYKLAVPSNVQYTIKLNEVTS